MPSAHATGATTGFSFDKSSITVVSADGSTDEGDIDYGAVFRITLSTAATTGAHDLDAGETITVLVTGVPRGRGTDAKSLTDNADDLNLRLVEPGYDNGNPYYNGPDTRDLDEDDDVTEVVTQTFSVYDETAGDYENLGGTGLTIGEEVLTYKDGPLATSRAKSLFLQVLPDGAAVIDEGEYTIRVRLSRNGILVKQDTLKVSFVSDPIDSGAKLSAADAGAFQEDTAHDTYSADKYINATLTDANNGRLVHDDEAGSFETPSLTVDLRNSTNTAAVTGSAGLAAVDDGSESDHSYSTTAGAAESLVNNGVYGITATADSFPAISTTNQVRVRYGAASALTTINIISAASGTAGTPFVSAAGLPVTDVSPNWSLPLTTKSATVVFPGGTSGKAYTVTTTWSAYASGSVTPESATPTVYYADSNGRINVALTNSAPVDGATATVSITGFATGTAADQILTWRASKAAEVDVDIAGAYVKTKSTNVATATVTDHFGAPVVGVSVVPSFSSDSEFYSATRTYAALTTNASGQVSYTWTDATAAADDVDSITFSVVGTAVSGSGTITYAAATPAPATLTAYYNADPGATQNFASVNTAVPATGIYASGTTPFAVKIARNNSKPITVDDGEDTLVIRVDGDVKGAKVVATGTSGVWFKGAANLAVTSKTEYANTFGDTYFVVGSTKSGANTVTFTAGTVTTTAAFWTATALGNARFVTMTGPATGTANGALLSYAVSVTDRYGNPIKGATVSITASGAAVLGGGSTVGSYTTDSTGAFSFTGTSLDAAGGTGTFKVSVTTGDTLNDMKSSAGLVGATSVESTVAAGNDSQSINVTFAAGSSAAQVAAEAATDAALEAIDAANAATDAANLAAEAADAATVAAEEARDAADAATAAVEALASEVATLIASLKAQITTLANTVAKIAKKVKA